MYYAFLQYNVFKALAQVRNFTCKLKNISHTKYISTELKGIQKYKKVHNKLKVVIVNIHTKSRHRFASTKKSELSNT